MDKSSGELVTLTPNNNNTVQPVALMRLGVFVPTLKSLKNSKKNTLSRTDATEELTRLSLARAEGFDKVEITGPRLDMDNDFKTWVGIIHSFARHNVIGDKVELPFVEFAKLCGIPSSRSGFPYLTRKHTDDQLDERPHIPAKLLPGRSGVYA